MPDHHEVYRSEADQYERLVAREDKDGNILKTLRQLAPLSEVDVVETGAGTGRLTCLLAPEVKSLRAFDISKAMLAVARARLEAMGHSEVSTGVADHRSLPVADASADVLISGWSVCYLVDWDPAGWRAQLDLALAEFRRVLRPGGRIILLETEGTGFETPHPPDHLCEYYKYLREHGFQSTWIRTDYCFASPAEAVDLATFFFGTDLGNQVLASASPILPECTGVWWVGK